MKLFGFDISRTQVREAGTTPTPTPSSANGQNFMGNISYASGVESCKTIAAVYRAISLRANAMARLVAQYQIHDAKGDNFTQDMRSERARNINYLLQVRPNPYIGWTQMMKQAEVRRLMWGNAYIYVERDVAGDILGLWLCSNASYIPGENAYHVTYYIGNVLYTRNFVPARDVLHIRNEFTVNGFDGVGTIRYAARTFNLAATQEQLAMDTASKGGARKLVVQEQAQQNFGLGKATKTQMEKITRDFAENIGLNDVTYLTNVADIKDFSQTLAELELLQSRKFSITEVSQFFSVPKALLGDDTNSNYKSPEYATLDFLSNGIAPTICEWEDEMNGKLLKQYEFGVHRFHLCESALFRLDRQGQAIWNKSRMETGMVSINELRAEQEMPRIENGDDHYVSTNLAVAGSPKLSGVDTKVTEKL